MSSSWDSVVARFSQYSWAHLGGKTETSFTASEIRAVTIRNYNIHREKPITTESETQYETRKSWIYSTHTQDTPDHPDL